MSFAQMLPSAAAGRITATLLLLLHQLTGVVAARDLKQAVDDTVCVAYVPFRSNDYAYMETLSDDRRRESFALARDRGSAAVSSEASSDADWAFSSLDGSEYAAANSEVLLAAPDVNKRSDDLYTAFFIQSIMDIAGVDVNESLGPSSKKPYYFAQKICSSNCKSLTPAQQANIQTQTEKARGSVSCVSEAQLQEDPGALPLPFIAGAADDGALPIQATTVNDLFTAPAGSGPMTFTSEGAVEDIIAAGTLSQAPIGTLFEDAPPFEGPVWGPLAFMPDTALVPAVAPSVPMEVIAPLPVPAAAAPGEAPGDADADGDGDGDGSPGSSSPRGLDVRGRDSQKGSGGESYSLSALLIIVGIAAVLFLGVLAVLIVGARKGHCTGCCAAVARPNSCSSNSSSSADLALFRNNPTSDLTVATAPPLPAEGSEAGTDFPMADWAFTSNHSSSRVGDTAGIPTGTMYRSASHSGSVSLGYLTNVAAAAPAGSAASNGPSAVESTMSGSANGLNSTDSCSLGSVPTLTAAAGSSALGGPHGSSNMMHASSSASAEKSLSSEASLPERAAAPGIALAGSPVKHAATEESAPSPKAPLRAAPPHPASISRLTRSVDDSPIPVVHPHVLGTVFETSDSSDRALAPSPEQQASSAPSSRAPASGKPPVAAATELSVPLSEEELEDAGRTKNLDDLMLDSPPGTLDATSPVPILDGRASRHPALEHIRDTSTTAPMRPVAESASIDPLIETVGDGSTGSESDRGRTEQGHTLALYLPGFPSSHDGSGWAK